VILEKDGYEVLIQSVASMRADVPAIEAAVIGRA
jgi:hypothetical protein